MPEQDMREKVIKELNEEVKRADYIDTEYLDCVEVSVLRDALALLKAQEPVEYVVHCKNADLSNGTEFACGECGGSLLHKRVNYCPWCGQAVKWE